MNPEREATAVADLAKAIAQLELDPMPGTRTDIADLARIISADPALREVSASDFVVSPDAPPARLYSSTTLARSALVWIHGGTFVGGDVFMPEAAWPAIMLASQGIAVLNIDYRKALGGVRHPVPLHDVLEGWDWAVRNLATWAGPNAQLSIGGASAGASLAAAAARVLADTGGARPASVILLYPTLHPELPAKSDELLATLESTPDDRRFVASMVQVMARNLIGPDGDIHDPLAFPGLGPVNGLPPIYILNSEEDDLRASGEAFAATLRTAGCAVRVEFEPGTYHGHLNEPGLPASRRSISRMQKWLMSVAARP